MKKKQLKIIIKNLIHDNFLIKKNLNSIQHFHELNTIITITPLISNLVSNFIGGINEGSKLTNFITKKTATKIRGGKKSIPFIFVRNRLFRKNLFKNTKKLAKLHYYRTNTQIHGTPKASIYKKKYVKKHTNVKYCGISSQKYGHFFSHFFFKLFKNPVYLINFNYFTKVKIRKFNDVVRSLFYKFSFLKKTALLYKILKLAAASLIYKDTSVLMFAIRDVFESVHYSRHRIYFRFWQKLLQYFLAKYYKKIGVHGMKLEFHGKLGVGGNSKKRSYYYKVGSCSNSTKYFKVDASSSFFKTDTGVVGYTYSIYY